MAALRMGFLTNITNPKVTLFFLALFTQVISRDTPTYVRVAYGVEMSAMTFAWFAIVAIVFSQPIVKEKFGKVQHHVEKVFGVLLIALGIKVALSRAN
jgi:threonine/homoserine/homoserine lactone efflux protein